MPRLYEMMIVIYSSIERLVLGVKTTLCEVNPSWDEQQLARSLAALHVGMRPGRIR
jgi:hypothetical protein